nr:hypothetical protein [Phycisphaerae bacterium]
MRTIELKENWFINVPNWYGFWEIAKCRFEPATMSTLAMGGMAFSTGSQIFGNIQQGKDAEKLANARAQIDIRNAELARQSSVEEAKILREQGEELKGRQKALIAASGVRLDTGSP